MALVDGTSAGFVLVAPTTDPTGTNSNIDNKALAGKFTSPAGKRIRITEVGWYCDTASEAANFDIAIYSDDATGEPNLIVFSTLNTAKGTLAGWKVVSGLTWVLAPGTVCWFGLQLDDTATATNANNTAAAGSGLASLAAPLTALPNDWGTSAVKDTTTLFGMYALYVVIPPDARSTPRGVERGVLRGVA